MAQDLTAKTATLAPEIRRDRPPARARMLPWLLFLVTLGVNSLAQVVVSRSRSGAGVEL